MKYVFNEPKEYVFKDRDGHDGKVFGTKSETSGHLIIECHDKLKVKLTQNEVEFTYYILEGFGYFIIKDIKYSVSKGDLVVIPPQTQFTFGGDLKMLLINTPIWSDAQELKEDL